MREVKKGVIELFEKFCKEQQEVECYHCGEGSHCNECNSEKANLFLDYVYSTLSIHIGE